MHIHTPACEACKLAFKLFSCNLETCRDRFSRTFFSFLALRSSNICNTCKKSIFFTLRWSILMGHKTLLTYVDFTVVLPRKIFFCCTSANSCVTELEDKTKSDHDQNGDIRHDPASASSSSPSGSKKWRQDWRGWWAWNHHHYKSVAWVGFSLASLRGRKKIISINSSRFMRTKLVCSVFSNAHERREMIFQVHHYSANSP